MSRLDSLNYRRYQEEQDMRQESERIDIGNLARRSARKNAAKPGTVRVIPDKRKKAPRHKKPLRGDE